MLYSIFNREKNSFQLVAWERIKIYNYVALIYLVKMKNCLLAASAESITLYLQTLIKCQEWVNQNKEEKHLYC